MGSGPFSHIGLAAGTCATCHRAGGSATAKPANHLATALSCDLCHRTTAWLPAAFTHANAASGACSSCHTPGGATAKPASHFLTGQACDTCHRSIAAWLPATYAHITPAFAPHMSSVRCIDCHITNNATVIWKFPTLKPGCGGCHGPAFSPTSGRKSIGAPVGRPQ
jgi:ribosomal protein S27E